MFSIYDGRSEFYQWDIDRKIIVNDKTINQVHFCNRTDDCSLVCEVYELDGLRVADVPNILLQNDWRINVYGYDVNYTKHSQCFKVKTRTKPASYAYTETEIKTWERVEAQTGYYVPAIDEEGNLSWQASKDTLPEALGANIKGPKGEDGKDGKDGENNINDSAIGSDGWSSKKIIDTLAPAFTKSGAAVTCEPVENYPLSVVSSIVPKQNGSGTPSPVNVRPIEAHSAVNLTQCGKNLFDYKDWVAFAKAANNNSSNAQESVTYLERECFSYPLYRRDTTVFFTDIQFKPNTQYTFKMQVAAPDLNDSNNLVKAMAIIYEDGSQSSYLETRLYADRFVEVAVTSQAGKTIKHLAITRHGVSSAVAYVPIDSCVIMEGTTAEYEPYTGDTFTMDLGQSIYGGSLDWNTGTLINGWYLLNVKDLAGTRFNMSGEHVNIPFYQDTPVADANNRQLSICSHFPYGSPTNTNVFWLDSTGTGLRLKVDGVTTKEGYIQWVEENEPMVAYPLATTTTSQLTPQEIKALAGVNTLYSDTGDTAVSGRADLTAVIAELQQAIISLGGNV